MWVLATAGHVDHGKSTLVRALTGMEPDRWAEEHRRGMTIDLGYAWTRVGDEQVAFVDVPGHQRFIANMLAGLGPVTAILFVVAADEGWRQQSAEHLAAIHALGLSHAILAVTKSDLADPAPTMEQARREIGTSSLGSIEAVAVSAKTGAGLPELRAALARLAAELPPPVHTGPVRLWIDRRFSVVGSGTVVTGTLSSGRLAVNDEIEINSAGYRIRGLHQAGTAVTEAVAVGRVAVNIRGISTEEIRRGDALLTPGAWAPTATIDVRLDADADAVGTEGMLHVGTAAVAVRIRPLHGRLARLRLHRPLPLTPGDRAILRDPGAQRVRAGVEVLDSAPAKLTGRGAAGRRAAELNAAPDPLASERRRRELLERLVTAVDEHAHSHPLAPGLPDEAARQTLGLARLSELRTLVDAAGLVTDRGRITRVGTRPCLGGAEAGLVTLEARLAGRPFAAPEQGELHELGLGHRELAAAVALGRLVALPDQVYLLPDAPALAMRALSALVQPFTTSQARTQLGSSRRVVIPLLEHLDSKGWTERIDAGHRKVRR
jgi:selenocysteine-specific elongation factor